MVYSGTKRRHNQNIRINVRLERMKLLQKVKRNAEITTLVAETAAAKHVVSETTSITNNETICVGLVIGNITDKTSFVHKICKYITIH